MPNTSRGLGTFFFLFLSKNLQEMLMYHADFWLFLYIQECLPSSLANPCMIIGKVVCYSFMLLPNTALKV